MVCGLSDEVLGAVALLLDDILPKDEAEEGGSKPEVRLVVPNSSCGGLIGKNGAILNSLVAKSFAGIQVSRVDRHSVATGERLVTVTGNFEVQLKAIELILEELCKDLKYQPNLTSPFPYGGGPQCTIGVVDAKIGSLLGYGGSILNGIMKASGATIKISKRGDFIPGTSQRKVTITAASQAPVDATRGMIVRTVSGIS